ncbi:MAG: 3-isopropylmalate dehydratase small subunit [Desulfobacterales bacterium]|nr:MAG: 3-isopropylmalate dehydratase small subunit [Desulfobacterales bacterium]
MLKGRAIKLGNDISTDLIAPGRYMHLRNNLPELAKHALEDADPDFVAKVKAGDFIVAGKNFGLGSSREHAPLIIKMSGIGAVIAESVGRIFFRNAINIGLPVIIAATQGIDDGNELEIDLASGTLDNLSSGAKLNFAQLPPVMLQILEEGGLIPYIRKFGDLQFQAKR